MSFWSRISFHNNLKVLARVSIKSGWLRLSLGRSLGEAMLEETHDVIIHPSLLEERDKSIFWCTDISTDSGHSVTLVLITTELKMGVGCFWIPSREFVFCLIWEPLFSSSATNCVCVWSEEKQDDGAAGAITLCILTPSGTDVQLHPVAQHAANTAGGWCWLRGKKSRTQSAQIHENLPLFGCKNSQLKAIL